MKSKTTVYEVVNSLTKVEAAKVILHLNSLDTRHARLQQDLFKLARSSRTVEVEVIEKRISSPELKEYLSYHKGILLQIILDVLRISSDNLEISERQDVILELDKVIVLRSKGFEDEAIKSMKNLLQRTEKVASPYLRLLALQDKYKLIRAIPSNDRAVVLEQVGAEKVALLNIIRNETALEILSDRMYQIYLRYHQNDSQEVSELIKPLANDPLLLSEDAALSFTARVFYNKAHVFRFGILGNIAGQIMHQERIIELWNGDLDQKSRNKFLYKYALVNLLNLYCKGTRFKECPKLFEEAEKISLADKKENSAAELALSDAYLLYLMNAGTFEEIVRYEIRVRDAIPKLRQYAIIGSVVNIEFNLACLLFLSGEFKKAAKYFNDIIQLKAKIRMDLKGMSIVLQNLAEFNRGDSEYSHSLNTKARRFFRKNHELNGLDNVVFRMLDRLLNSTQKEHQSIYTEAVQGLSDLSSPTKAIAGFHEVVCWIKSKQGNKEIQSVWQDERKLA